MTDIPQKFRAPEFGRSVITIVGGYGSGKSEVAVNLARHLAASQPEPVTIADLDIINPYFRSREAARELADLGIRSIVPPGAQAQADLPIVLPEIKGSIKDHDGYLILDVGGDDLGARVLRSLSDAFAGVDYELLLVMNANRPFTATVEGTRRVMSEIEQASGLQFTGLIANTHLMEHTTAETVLTGLKLARKVADETALPISFVAATETVARDLTPRKIRCPLLTLDRSLLKPWERRAATAGVRKREG